MKGTPAPTLTYRVTVEVFRDGKPAAASRIEGRFGPLARLFHLTPDPSADALITTALRTAQRDHQEMP